MYGECIFSKLAGNVFDCICNTITSPPPERALANLQALGECQTQQQKLCSKYAEPFYDSAELLSPIV